MTQIFGCDLDEPEIIPIVGTGEFRHVFPVFPVIGMRNHKIFIGMPDDIIQVAPHSIQIEIDRGQVRNQYIVCKIKIVLRRTGHRNHFAIKIMSIGFHLGNSPGNGMIGFHISGLKRIEVSGFFLNGCFVSLNFQSVIFL